MTHSDPIRVPDLSALEQMVGADLGASDWTTVEQRHIDEFARATGDHQWIHVDVDRARRESPFGGTIAHGYLTMSLAPTLLPQLLVVEKLSRVVNSGIEKLRFKEPVPAGGRVRISGQLKDVRRMPGDAARVTIALRWELEGAKRPACVADVVYVYYS